MNELEYEPKRPQLANPQLRIGRFARNLASRDI
jgi:hypothetical protein